jgi:hypothetical protein
LDRVALRATETGRFLIGGIDITASTISKFNLVLSPSFCLGQALPLLKPASHASEPGLDGVLLAMMRLPGLGEQRLRRRFRNLAFALKTSAKAAEQGETA